MKSFKTFITEVRVGYDEGIPKFKAQSNDDISKNNTITLYNIFFNKN